MAQVRRTARHLVASALALAGAMFTLPAASPIQAQSSPPASERCQALARLARPELVFESVDLVEAGPAPGGPPGAERGMLPAHCRVRATIDPRTGVGERTFGIGFELRLPLDWSGRFMFQGGGGLDGVIGAAVGTIPNSAGPPALARGFAVVSTDAGHKGSPVDASFGLDQQARIDFAYNALAEVTREAKALVAAFYGGRREGRISSAARTAAGRR
jgi:feruloyl esterase